MSKIYNPQNEFGKVLVPAGQARLKGTETIDISWLNTANNNDYSKLDDDNKIVLVSLLKELQNDLQKQITDINDDIITKIKDNLQFEIKLLESKDDLPTEFSEDTIKELRKTIYLVPENGADDEDDNYKEYICKNVPKSLPTTETPEYEVLGRVFELNQATDETAGIVTLTDEIDESDDVESGKAATPKAVADKITSEIESALEDDGAIKEAIDAAIESISEEWEADSAEIAEKVDGLKTNLETLKSDVEEAYTTKTYANKEITNGKVELTVEEGEVFVSCLAGNNTTMKLFIPDVEVSGTTMTITFYDASADDTPDDLTKATIYTSAKIKITEADEA